MIRNWIWAWVMCAIVPTCLMSQSDALPEAVVEMERKLIAAHQKVVLGEVEEAIEAYEQLASSYPEEAVVHYELARLYEHASQSGEALASARRAVRYDPQNKWYLIVLADAYHHNQEPLKAAEIFADLRKMEPEVPEHAHSQAYFLTLAEKVAEAIQVFDFIEEKWGVMPEVSSKKIFLYLQQGNIANAESEMIRLADAFPHQISYRHALAEFYVEQDKRSEALHVYEQILTIDPDDSQARLALKGGPAIPKGADQEQQLLAVFADPDVAIDLKIKQILPEVVLLTTSNEPSRAIELLKAVKTIADAHPREAKALALYGDVLYHAGHPQDAVVQYEKALTLDKSVFAVWEQLMFLQAESGDFKALQYTAEESLDLFPNQAATYVYQGQALAHHEQYDQAINAFQQASLMARRDKELLIKVHIEWGKAQLAAGDRDAARNHWQKAMELGGDEKIINALINNM